VEKVTARHGATVAQVALAWMLASSPVMLAIPGTGSLDRASPHPTPLDRRQGPSPSAGVDRSARLCGGLIVGAGFS
jgi:hypothetical protein